MQETPLTTDANELLQEAVHEQSNPDTEVEVSIEDLQSPDLEAQIAVLLAEKQGLEAQLHEQKEQNLRIQADFINFRKRKEKETTDTIAFANEGLLKLLLPILDDFERTLEVVAKSDNLSAIQNGIGMVAKNMKNTLSKIGLEPMDALGKPFDANLHEALTTIPVEEEDKKGLIFDVIENGYTLKDKVIRVAKVVIAE